MGDWTGDFDRSSGDFERGRYEGRGYRQRRFGPQRDIEPEYDRGFERGRGEEDYYDGPTGGMFGGGFGGYTGGGYQGYNPGEANRGRSQGGWSGYGGGNYGRGESPGERDFDRSSERLGRSARENYDRDDDRGFFERIGDQVSSWFDDDYDENRRQSFRGRGPRNYSRSDDRIREDVNDRLTDHDYLDASDIEVEVNNGEVILSGSVSSRYAKRMAEDIAESVSGVRNVENRIRVSQTWGQNEGTYSQTASGSSATSPTGGSDLATGSGTFGRSGTSGPVSGTDPNQPANKGRGRAAGGTNS
jgi:osmotically-inducible protein OsmY